MRGDARARPERLRHHHVALQHLSSGARGLYDGSRRRRADVDRAARRRVSDRRAPEVAAPAATRYVPADPRRRVLVRPSAAATPPRRAPAQATKGRKTQSDALVFGKLHNVSRKNLHMQVAYPETVAKLQPPWGDLTRKQTPQALKTFDPALAVTRGCERLEPYERTNPGMARTMFIPGRIPVGPGFALALKNTTPAVRRCKDHRRRCSYLRPSADPDRPSQPRRRRDSLRGNIHVAAAASPRLVPGNIHSRQKYGRDRVDARCSPRRVRSGAGTTTRSRPKRSARPTTRARADARSSSRRGRRRGRRCRGRCRTRGRFSDVRLL